MTRALRRLEKIPKVWELLSFILVFVLSAVLGANSVRHTDSTVPKASAQTPSPHHHLSVTPSLLNLQGKGAVLHKGSRGSVILTMAPWCRFCAYEDRWVLPRIAQVYPSVAINVIDVSSMGGMASPGPEYPPFHGMDGRRTKSLPQKTVLSVMQQYINRLHLSQSTLNFYVIAPGQTDAPATQAIPQWYIVNPQGNLVAHYQGALTSQQAIPWIHSLLNP